MAAKKKKVSRRVSKYLKEKAKLLKDMEAKAVFVFETFARQIDEILEQAQFNDEPTGSLNVAIELMRGKHAKKLGPATAYKVNAATKSYLRALKATNCRSDYSYEADEEDCFETTRIVLPMKRWNAKLLKQFGVKLKEDIEIEVKGYSIGTAQPNTWVRVDFWVDVHIPLAADLDTEDLKIFAALFHEHWEEARSLASLSTSVI